MGPSFFVFFTHPFLANIFPSCLTGKEKDKNVFCTAFTT
jgi:hypothetical protein